MSLSISHTCHRFRILALRLPRLWSSFSNRQHPDELCAFLERSKNSPVSIEIRDGRSRTAPWSTARFFSERCREFLEVLSNRSNRWQTFTFDTSRGFESATEIHCTLRHLRTLTLDLPSLTTLRVSFFDAAIRRAGEEALQQDQSHFVYFYSSWKMPELRYLQTSNVVPYPPHSTVPLSCAIHFDPGSSCTTFGPDLKALIYQTPNSFSLAISYDPDDGDDDEDEELPPFEQPAEFPLLETLKLKVHPEVIAHLLQNLSLSMLSEMDIQIILRLYRQRVISSFCFQN